MKSNYDKFPEVSIKGHTCYSGWDAVIDEINNAIKIVNSICVQRFLLPLGLGLRFHTATGAFIAG